MLGGSPDISPPTPGTANGPQGGLGSVGASGPPGPGGAPGQGGAPGSGQPGANNTNPAGGPTNFTQEKDLVPSFNDLEKLFDTDDSESSDADVVSRRVRYAIGPKTFRPVLFLL